VIRVNILAEGQTEETYARDVLAEHFGLLGIDCVVRCVKTSRSQKGGIVSYEKFKRDLTYWMREDKNAIFTSMIDLYALPTSFPGVQSCKMVDPLQRVVCIEQAISRDVNDDRFIPYIQLHEFEALLICSPLHIADYYFEQPDSPKRASELERICQQFISPEHINQGSNTAPSKRIIDSFPLYQHSKRFAGPVIAKDIGLTTLREKCQHFSQWLKTIEMLAQ
jgi:hypothetical protein